MNVTINVFKVGTLMAISKGEYSDYCIEGLFKVLKDFDAKEQMIVWAKETDREILKEEITNDYNNKNIDFMEWLNRTGFIEDVEYRELHTGNYGDTILWEKPW